MMPTQKKDERGKKSQTPRLKISKIQDLQLKVVGFTDHNNCNGKKIEKTLRQNHHLWKSVFIPSKQLYPLLEMEYDVWSADTLYAFVREGKEDELEQMMEKKLHADVINWIGSDRSIELLGYWKKDEAYNPRLILSAWWD